jgi:hypothetical protein
MESLGVHSRNLYRFYDTETRLLRDRKISPEFHEIALKRLDHFRRKKAA